MPGIMSKKHDKILPLIWEYFWISSLTLLTLGTIVWAGVIIWERPCRLVHASNCPPLLWDFETLLLAVGIWIIALVVQVLERRRIAATLFLLCAGALTAGKLSALDNDIGGRIFYILLSWLAPLAFHFNHALLDRPPHRLGRFIINGLYVLAGLNTLPFLFWSVMTLESRGEFLLLRLEIRLTLVLAFSLGWIVLFRDYHRSSQLVRQRIRLTVFGTLFAVVPLLLLSLLPETFGAPIYLPYEWTLPCLLLAPLSYAYSLFRRQLQKTEVTFNRLAVYYLAITILLSLYLTGATFLNYIMAGHSNYWTLVSALLGVGLVLVFAPLQRLLQRLIAWILYGGEIRYTEVVSQLAESFALALDREALRRLLLVEWPHVMRLPEVVAWLRDSDATLLLLGTRGKLGESMIDLQIPAGGHLGVYLHDTPPPIPDRRVKESFAATSLDKEEAKLLASAGIAYWLPLVSGDALQGLLLIGRRSDDDPFSSEDERILATMAHQMGIAAQNVRLTEEIRVARQELAHAHQQLLLEQDQSQRRLALELHDEGIQQLMGILFQLNKIQRDLSQVSLDESDAVKKSLTRSLQCMQDEIQSLVAFLRTLTYELHPPGLEEMGLSLALESYVNHLKDRGNLPSRLLKLDMDKIDSTDLPLPLATSLFRAAQEALRNALQHAQAKRIIIRLRSSTDRVILSVLDNGSGFRVPLRLSELTNNGHFGLVGISGRVAWAGGELKIHSQPGLGTKVIVSIPLGSGKERIQGQE